MNLSSSDDLQGGSETKILPPESYHIRDKYFVFPNASKNLVPVGIREYDTVSCRFSAFEFDQVTLCGFRLYSLGGKWFNDRSLVDAAGANKEYAYKLPLGFDENIPFNQRGDVDIDMSRVVDIDGKDCALLCYDEPANFGAFLYRGIPKLLLLAKERKIKSVMTYAAPKWAKSILNFIDPEIEIVHHNPRLVYAVHDALIPALASPEQYQRPETIDAFREMLDKSPKDVSPRMAGAEKIYISRRSMSIDRPGFRVLENETELVEKLHQHGFKEFIPEHYPFPEQMRIVSQAKIIVCVGGSNIYITYFAFMAELIVVLCGTRDFLFGFSNVVASQNANFSFVFGTPTERGSLPSHNNWIVDVDTLLDGMRTLNAL
ncbi:glycosyltransferase family 61 protein [Mesorhizobium australicum]|uniref:Glycosyltransferase 61 catalytic domain-containing protein n=1 Tax=Mesorhizobium australicum TaxID=536018 RepID=A0A1X7PAK1_9HYPH|nr:glycosyltransferase family 61 protein [Mesorhizobium australicum]SMH47944.1 Protein of unknown function [Mesorhizobium australicum]